jgi:AhpD family alkylhydroperoxidase
MHAQRQIAENQITELMGFVPDFYKALPDAAFNEAWQLQRSLELGETVLGAKTKELIGIAVASHMKCQYCVYFHTKAAETFGASKEEIREAALMGGMTSMMSNAVTAGQVELEGFKRDVDRAIAHIVQQLGSADAPAKTRPLQ